jgi:iron complex outermembrane recepter protein
MDGRRHVTRREQAVSLRLRGKSHVTLVASTSYKLLPNLELFAWAQNITNASYYTFGTLSLTSSVFIAQAPGATLTQSYSPAASFGILGGLRTRF